MPKNNRPLVLDTATPFKLGELVFPKETRLFSHAFQVWGLSLAWHCRHMRTEVLHFCRRIDFDTGLLYFCPDARRGPDHAGCPICSHNFWGEDIRPMTAAEAEAFHQEEMLHYELVPLARGRSS